MDSRDSAETQRKPFSAIYLAPAVLALSVLVWLLGAGIASSETTHGGSHHGTHTSIPSQAGTEGLDYESEPLPSRMGRFIVHCQPTVRDNVDPIVTPGVYGRSHSHDFYGPRSLHAHPSAAEILATKEETSCSDDLDGTVYWHPTLYRAGEPVAPQRAQAYYHVNDLTQPAPSGLSIIVGSPGTPATDGVRVRWVCGGDGSDHSHTTAVSCEEDEYLMAAVSFPGCWNGKDLVAADYISHMAYADSAGRCPKSHPNHIPQLDLFIQWDCAVICGRTTSLTLSSGSTGGWHGDVILNWPENRQKVLIEECAGKDCGVIGFEKVILPLRSAEVRSDGFLWPQIAKHMYLTV